MSYARYHKGMVQPVVPRSAVPPPRKATVRNHGRPKSAVTANDPITQQLIELIDAIGYDDGEVARRAGIRREEIGRYRRGVSGPRTHTLHNIINALGLECIIREREPSK